MAGRVGVAWHGTPMDPHSDAQPASVAHSRGPASRPQTISSCAEQTHKWPELSVPLKQGRLLPWPLRAKKPACFPLGP